jgi:hypothetical protein
LQQINPNFILNPLPYHYKRFLQYLRIYCFNGFENASEVILSLFDRFKVSLGPQCVCCAHCRCQY